MEKICWQITVAAFMQRLQYDLRDWAAKDNRITNAATARSNIDTAITMRSAETELQNTTELRTLASEILAPKPDLDARAEKKNDFEALFKRIFRRKITSAKMEKICWQITVAATARSNLDATTRHCGNGPTVAKHNGIPSATHPPAPLAIPFTVRDRSLSCKSQWNSVDRKCTKHRWKPNYNAEPIRPWSEHDPNMIRPHTRPSRNRRTAEVDHRGSGTDFVWKNI